MERIADALFFLGSVWFIIELAKFVFLDLPHTRADLEKKREE
jgi:hypothetical protein